MHKLVALLSNHPIKIKTAKSLQRKGLVTMIPLRSIKVRLLLFALCLSLISIMAITTIYYLKARSILKREALGQVKAIAESKRLPVSYFMEAKKVRTLDFSADKFLRNRLMSALRAGVSQPYEIIRLNRYLLKKLPFDRYLVAISLIDKDGKVIVSTSGKFRGIRVSDQDIFKQGIICISRKDVFIDKPHYEPRLDMNCICISTPIISDYDADLMGLIITTYDLAVLSEVTTNLAEMGKTGEIYLVNRDKVMLTKSRFIENAPLNQIVDTEPVQKIITGGKEMVGVYRDYRGVPVVGASIDMPEYGWILLSEVNKAEAFAPLKTWGITAFTFGIAGTGVVAIIGIILAGSLSRPIEVLKDGVEKFTRGQLDYRVNIVRNDEIGVLASGLNMMAEGLAGEIAEHKRAEEELRVLNESLERRVTERTSLLTKANEELQNEIAERNRIENKLRQIEAELHLIMNSISDYVWSAEVDKAGKFFYRYYSSVVAHITGRPPEFYMQGSEYWLSTIYPEDRQRLKNVYTRIAMGKSDHEEEEYRIALPDGTVRWVRDSVVAKRNEHGILRLHGIVSDITKRKLAEERVKKYEILFSEIRDLAYICDAKGNILFVNKIFRKLTGHRPEEFIGKPFAPLFDKKNLEKAIDVYTRTLKGESLQFELSFKDTETICEYKNIPLRDEKGNIIGVIGIARDITGHKRMEELLRKGEECLRTVVTNVPVILWALDKQGVFTLLEGKGLDSLRIKSGKFVEKSLLEALGASAPDIKERFHHALAGEEPSPAILELGGKVFDIRYSLIYGARDEAHGMIGVATDITELKRIEDALRKSQTSLANAQRIAHIGNWEWDVVKNSVTWSDEVYRIFGIEPQAFVATYEAFIDLVHPDDREFVKKSIHDALYERKPFCIDHRIIVSDGSLRFAHCEGEVIFDSTGRPVQMNGIIQDITERKQIEEELRILNESLEKRVQERTSELIKTNGELRIKIEERERAEEALRESEERYRNLIENAQDVIYTLSSDGTILLLNPAFETITGWPRAEWLHKQFIPLIHPDDQPAALDLFSHVLKGETPPVFELRILSKSGIYLIGEFKVTPQVQKGSNIRLLGIGRNITERKCAEEALRASEKKYRLLIENLPQRIFYKDRNLAYVSCNENLARDLHMRPDEIVGKTDYDLYPKVLAEKYERDDKRIIKSEKAEAMDEQYIKNGWELIIHTVRTPIRDEKGNIIGILGIFWDITEKVTLERQAIRSRHLASLGELSASIGHEINNPITGIINCAQILFNKSGEGSKERDLSSRIIKEGNRIANITSRLLSFARIGDAKEKKSMVSIKEILSDTLPLTEALLRKEGIKLKIDIPEDLPKVVVHPQQIQQVFLNAINNARYALNKKYPGPHEDKILEILGEETIINSHAYVKIIFYDHGIGIPAHLRNKVLEPFFTTKPRGAGTGLGLSISFSIVKDHGGRLVIDSVEGEFTKIIILLPACKPAFQAAEGVKGKG